MANKYERNCKVHWAKNQKLQDKTKFESERLAELSGCHTTYIGQVERGEKNATLESVEKIACALNIPLSRLFEKLVGNDNINKNIPLKCYEFILSKINAEQ